MKKSATAPLVKVSQQRIAKELGLSQALVSMVLNGRRDGISEASYRSIWETAISMGYQPKGMRATISGDGSKPMHVGFILRSGLTLHTQSNYFTHIQHGLHEALQARGMSTVFLGAEGSLDDAVFRTTLEMRKTLFGVVILGEVSLPFLKTIKKICPRVVSVSMTYPGECHSVQSNEKQSLDFLVEHLVSLGHRSFAWIGGNRALARHADRYNAFKAALKTRGISFDESWALVADAADRVEGLKAAEQLLAHLGPRPTAAVCYNALMARGAINYLQSQGLRIPADLSIVSIDATRICTEEHPMITGASADPEAMGRKTAELLLGTSGEEDEVYLDAVLPSRLSVRETTAPLAQ